MHTSRGAVLLPPRHESALTPPRSLFHASTPPRSSRTAPPTGPAPPPRGQNLHSTLPSHLSQRRVVEAVVRTNPKLRLPRHHSEESLQARGVYGQLGGPNGIYASKIHSSADEISSMNRLATSPFPYVSTFNKLIPGRRILLLMNHSPEPTSLERT